MSAIDEANKILVDLFRDDWMTDHDWNDFLIAAKEKGITPEKIAEDIEIGVSNGHSIEYQINLVKKLLEGLQ